MGVRDQTGNLYNARLASSGRVKTRQREQAKVAELVDALDLGSSGATRESSSLSFRTRFGSSRVR